MPPREVEPLAGHPKYVKIRDLNKGAFGFVQLAQEIATGDLVAVKFLERGDKISKYVEREIINHCHLLHPHIIQFKEVFLTPDYLAIVMEFAAGGDMFQFVVKRKGLPENEARWFFQQLILGVDYCHRMGVVNRDIKLENTLLDGSVRPLLKICDFGYSKSIKDSLARTKVGTPGYAAPEVISNRRHYDGKMADVWSAGVMLYVMLFCEYPFERPEDKHDQRRFQKILQRIATVDYVFPKHIQVSDECRDLLTRILVDDVSKRITIEAITRHPWYVQDLPPGVLAMNEQCLGMRDETAGIQTEDTIKAVLADAKHVPGMPALPPPNEEEDFYIDEVMDGEAF